MNTDNETDMAKKEQDAVSESKTLCLPGMLGKDNEASSRFGMIVEVMQFLERGACDALRKIYTNLHNKNGPLKVPEQILNFQEPGCCRVDDDTSVDLAMRPTWLSRELFSSGHGEVLSGQWDSKKPTRPVWLPSLM